MRLAPSAVFLAALVPGAARAVDPEDADCIAIVPGNDPWDDDRYEEIEQGSLADCLEEVESGGKIYAERGNHPIPKSPKSPKSLIDKPVTLGGAGSGQTRLFYGGFPGEELVQELLDDEDRYLWSSSDDSDPADLATLAVMPTTGTVTLEDLTVLPPAIWGLAGSPWVIGRAITVQDAVLKLRNVHMRPTSDARPIHQRLKAWDKDLARVSEDEGHAGGVFVHASGGATVRLYEAEVEGLDGTQLDGAAVYARGAGTRVIVHPGTTLRNVRSRYGALAAFAGARIEIQGTASDPDVILSNNSGHRGGAVAFGPDTSGTITGARFTNNVAAGRSWMEARRTPGLGAGIHVAYDAEVVVEGSRFEDGQAERGGAVSVRGGDLQVMQTLFEDNVAGLGGHLFAGVLDDVKVDAALRVDNSTFKGGKALAGGAIHASDVLLDVSKAPSPTMGHGRGRTLGRAGPFWPSTCTGMTTRGLTRRPSRKPSSSEIPLLLAVPSTFPAGPWSWSRWSPWTMAPTPRGPTVRRPALAARCTRSMRI